ncbi:hypothetical protein DFQ11_102466 [Winogradskyella epiphytica]|uniref:Outer membrane protein with beta-barrel domain n=1 Tax=Winogradskyella epiphytica TaxID=262005 RepID=A0A2V4Y0F1_9FLAO|nr:hypothetical protein [Winogradskyella epiphytica]PYE81888.1 hypothetical protein DFQ11_102466 [Winogradskyella epiphytica]GGW61972.1 hypothetical protein GCM10008085_12050 [Winogradskyella epiphytica]
MKKLLFMAAVAVFGFTNVNAQENDHGGIQEGKWLIEINTGSWTTGSTAFSLTSSDGETMWSAGLEGGYFLKENLAIKAGLGYSDNGNDGIGSSAFNYKIGAKYYIANEFPVGIDYTGSSIKDFDENPSYIGLEGGYAWFISPKVSIEPKLRYNVSMNSDFYDDAFQFLVGFAIHL